MFIIKIFNYKSCFIDYEKGQYYNWIICSCCKFYSLYHIFYKYSCFRVHSCKWLHVVHNYHLTVYVRECRIFEVSRTLWSRYRKYCNMTVAWTVCGKIEINCKKKKHYDRFSYHGGWENTNPFASEQYKIIVSPSNTGEVAMTLGQQMLSWTHLQLI